MTQTDNKVFASIDALHALWEENKALTTEVERLKAVLKTIMQNAEFYDDEDDSLAVIYRVASKALTGTPEKNEVYNES